MCGIVGVVNQEPKNIAYGLIRANKQMYRRGPDDEGIVLFQGDKVDICYGADTPLNDFLDKQNYYPSVDALQLLDCQYEVGLGHRRLSILDLSSHGHQPMCDKTQRYWIVFNGEVYNFKEIRKKLVALGHVFISDTDTEVVLASYLQWGKDCLHQFNGMFAFAIYDRQAKKIFLARDRIGIKPLYYTLQNGSFIFASDIKTIIATQLYKPEVNWEGIYHNFSFTMAPRPMTAFHGVYALKQAHFMEVDCRTLECVQLEYWDVPTNIQDFTMSEADAVELLEYELKKSIKYRLIADVDVGTFMSGGIDSTTISAIASKIHPNIKAFTLAFDKSISEYDEVEEAKKTASMNNINHIVSTLDADVVLNNIDDMVLGYEEPFSNLAANFAISEIVKNNGVKVVLNGLGGDELFYGYSFYGQVQRWKILSKLKLLTDIAPDFLHPKVKTLKKLSAPRDVYQYYASCYCNFTDREKNKLFAKKFNSMTEIYRQYGRRNKVFSDDLELLSYLDIKSYIGNHHVHRTDQFTMHFSIEGRFPFLDHNLIEKAFTIPSSYKMNNKVPKHVLRKVAEKYIAKECLSMQKKGFGLPLNYWINSQLKDLVETTIQSLLQRNFFNKGAITSIMQSNQHEKKWHLVMFELWYQRFIEQGF